MGIHYYKGWGYGV